MGGKARVGLSTGIHRALEDLAPVLDQHRGCSVVIGDIAVIARGVPRVTRDVDAAFSGAEVTLSGLLTDLDAAGIVPRIDDAIGFAAQSQVLLSRHARTASISTFEMAQPRGILGHRRLPASPQAGLPEPALANQHPHRSHPSARAPGRETRTPGR